MKWIRYSVAFFWLLNLNLLAQMPQTSLWYLKISEVDQNSWTVQKLKYLSNFNQNSYNNQPYFINDHEFLATIGLKTKKDPDIYHFDLKNETYTILLDHKLSDYSARIHPLYKDELTTVQVSMNPDTMQKLVSYDMISGVQKKVILAKHGKIGYYRFLSPEKWVCFIVDEFHLLAICDEKLNERQIFASNIGRCFEVLENGKILFVQKTKDLPNKLKLYDPKTKQMEILTELPAGVEDFALTENGSIICGQGSKLFSYQSDSKSWKNLLDLNAYGITNMKRIAFNNKQLIIVNEQ